MDRQTGVVIRLQTVDCATQTSLSTSNAALLRWTEIVRKLDCTDQSALPERYFPVSYIHRCVDADFVILPIFVTCDEQHIDAIILAQKQNDEEWNELKTIPLSQVRNQVVKIQTDEFDLFRVIVSDHITALLGSAIFYVKGELKYDGHGNFHLKFRLCGEISHEFDDIPGKNLITLFQSEEFRMNDEIEFCLNCGEPPDSFTFSHDSTDFIIDRKFLRSGKILSAVLDLGASPQPNFKINCTVKKNGCVLMVKSARIPFPVALLNHSFKTSSSESKLKVGEENILIREIGEDENFTVDNETRSEQGDVIGPQTIDCASQTRLSRSNTLLLRRTESVPKLDCTDQSVLPEKYFPVSYIHRCVDADFVIIPIFVTCDEQHIDAIILAQKQNDEEWNELKTIPLSQVRNQVVKIQTDEFDLFCVTVTDHMTALFGSETFYVKGELKYDGHGNFHLKFRLCGEISHEFDDIPGKNLITLFQSEEFRMNDEIEICLNCSEPPDSFTFSHDSTDFIIDRKFLRSGKILTAVLDPEPSPQLNLKINCIVKKNGCVLVVKFAWIPFPDYKKKCSGGLEQNIDLNNFRVVGDVYIGSRDGIYDKRVAGNITDSTVVNAPVGQLAADNANIANEGSGNNYVAGSQDNTDQSVTVENDNDGQSTSSTVGETIMVNRT